MSEQNSVTIVLDPLSPEQIAAMTEGKGHLIFDLRLQRDDLLNDETPWYAWMRCFDSSEEDVAIATAVILFVTTTMRSWRRLNGDEAQVVFLAQTSDEEYAARFLAAVRERMETSAWEDFDYE